MFRVSVAVWFHTTKKGPGKTYAAPAAQKHKQKHQSTCCNF